MKYALIYHPDALPGYGTPMYPVIVMQRIGEPDEGFAKRVADTKAQLINASGCRIEYRADVKEAA